MVNTLFLGLAAVSLSGAQPATGASIAAAKDHAMTEATSEAMTEAMPKITIYHLEGRRSERIIWLMEELGLRYELKYVPGDLRASMAQIHALGHGMPMAPTVVIGDDILVESGAIIDTIVARYAPGKLTPKIESKAYPHHVKWMHYAEGSLAARLFSDYRAWRVNPPKQRSPLVDSENVVQYAENYLEENLWFGGPEFSGADIMMQWPLNVAVRLNLVDGDQFPNIAAWQEHIAERPAYIRMRAIATPNEIPGALPPVQRPPSGSRTKMPPQPPVKAK